MNGVPWIYLRTVLSRGSRAAGPSHSTVSIRAILSRKYAEGRACPGVPRHPLHHGMRLDDAALRLFPTREDSSYRAHGCKSPAAAWIVGRRRGPPREQSKGDARVLRSLTARARYLFSPVYRFDSVGGIFGNFGKAGSITTHGCALAA